MNYLGKWILVGALVLALGGGAAAQVVLKIGYVDFEKVLESWPEAKQKMEEMQSQRDQLMAKMKGLEENIKQKKDEIEARAGMFSSKEEEQKQQEEYRAMMKNYAESFQKERQSLEEQQRAMLETVRIKVKAVVQDVAERNGYSFIMSKQDLVYAVDEFDVTDEVIQALSKQN